MPAKRKRQEYEEADEEEAEEDESEEEEEEEGDPLPRRSSRQGSSRTKPKPKHAQPSAEPRDRRRVRQKIQQHTASTVAHRQQLVKNEDDSLIKNLEIGNELLTQVQHPREGDLDASYFCTATQIGHEFTANLQVGQEKGAEDFCSALLETYGSNTTTTVSSVDWVKIGHTWASKCLRTAPAPLFMFGPLRREEKEKKVRAAPRERTKSQDPDKAEKGEERQRTDMKPEEGITTKKVQQLNDWLEQRFSQCRTAVACTPLVDALVDNTSFSKTVENFYHAAFLVRDGRIGVTQQGESTTPARDIVLKPGSQTIIPHNNNSQTQDSMLQQPKPHSQQCIVHINTDIYKEWCNIGGTAQQQQLPKGEKVPEDEDSEDNVFPAPAARRGRR